MDFVAYLDARTARSFVKGDTVAELPDDLFRQLSKDGYIRASHQEKSDGESA